MASEKALVALGIRTEEEEEDWRTP
jgi:hypothetical protein